MYLSGLPPPRPPRLHFVIFAKAIIPSLSTRPAAYLFLIGVHRGGIGQSSSFQDTYHTTLWEACAVEWTCGGGRREYPRLATGSWSPAASSPQVVASINYPYLARRGFSQTKADFPSRLEGRGTPRDERTPNIPKPKKKNTKTNLKKKLLNQGDVVESAPCIGNSTPLGQKLRSRTKQAPWKSIFSPVKKRKKGKKGGKTTTGDSPNQRVN